MEAHQLFAGLPGYQDVETGSPLHREMPPRHPGSLWPSRPLTPPRWLPVTTTTSIHETLARSSNLSAACCYAAIAAAVVHDPEISAPLWPIVCTSVLLVYYPVPRTPPRPGVIGSSTTATTVLCYTRCCT